MMKLFMGHNESYATIRSNILGMDPLPSVNKAYSMTLRHEKQVEVSAGSHWHSRKWLPLF